MKLSVLLCGILLFSGGPDEQVLSQIRESGVGVTLARSGRFGAEQIYIEIKDKKGDKELESVAPLLKKLSKVTGLHMHGSAVTDNGLAHLKGINNIDHIILENTRITDRGLEHLKHMTNLSYLDVTGTPVTDRGIAALKEALPKLAIQKLSPAQAKSQDEIHEAGGQTFFVDLSLEEINFRFSHLSQNTRFSDNDLRNLKEHLEVWKASLKRLDLTGTDVTDAGLVNLKELSNLKELTLTGTKVSDEGLKPLKDLKNLEKLQLIGTQVTDAGLEHLTGMTKLKDLRLPGTVSKEAAAKLQLALPDCKISR